ncbi:Protein of unknown function [Bacillus cereus]|nr:Protein of unknown function [Bacillus cereus]
MKEGAAFGNEIVDCVNVIEEDKVKL